MPMCGSGLPFLWVSPVQTVDLLQRRLVARYWGRMGRAPSLFCSYLQNKSMSLSFVWCLRTPRESLPCQRSARDEGFGTFVLLLPGRALDYLLEERQLVCGQCRMHPLSTFACLWVLHSMARQQRFFSCFLSSYIARCKAAGGGVAGLGQGVLW